MGKTKSPTIALSERFLELLRAQRELGPDCYPLTLRELAALADVQADAETVHKAFQCKPFKAEAIVAIKGNPRSPAALAADAGLLADSPQVLELLLAQTCTEAAPAVGLAALQKHLDTRLKKPFKEACERRIREDALPAALGFTFEKKKPLLFLNSMPPREPDVVLAEGLVRVLEAQRDEGSDAYPLLLTKLLALTAPTAPAALARKALDREPFKNRVLLSVPQARTLKDCPVALHADRELLAGSEILLRFLVELFLKPQARTAAVEDLAKKASPELRPLVRETLDRKAEQDTLPPEFGWMWINNKRHLFLLKDVHQGSRPAAAAPAAAAPIDFSAAFEAAFRQLDRAHGNHNFVSLVELRHAMPVDRVEFDAGLKALRVAGRYGLSPSDGRHGPTTSEQREAALEEDGTVLLFVSRKQP